MGSELSATHTRGRTGRVVRVSGPLVEIEGLTDVAMSELVGLGEQGLPGEVCLLYTSPSPRD